MSHSVWWGLLSLFLVLSSCGAGAAPHARIGYAALDTVLARHLHDGRVDYGALASARGPLERFLASTRETRPDGWSREDQIAFWVNVYNARVLDGVIRRPGLKSVLDVGKILGVPTLGFFREKSRSGGRDLSLNDIEHKILRESFREARIHFVLNCASVSCPELPARALTGAKLDSVLSAAASKFLMDPAKNQIAPSSELRLSAIFKWYRGDFESAAGSLQGFLQRNWNGQGVIMADAPIRFLDYDWNLNGTW